MKHVEEKLLETNLQQVCNKCAMHYWLEHRERPKELLDTVRDLTSLHEKGAVGEEVYRDLIRLAVSLYILSQIDDKVTRRLDKAFCAKLSPKNLFEALV